ncbi:TetR/AcrR family transcriptional regulator [Gemmata sp. JC717]|uniref:TetR/AcrR family transcriptional regulator n=1 Tax=Gemmata algarum TaxID=2975278 RepID=UPI0021BA9737|nr:TetR/AcrR family transcriptional regulator [Gemmata algarum]MDY3553866.1 TetR/AcrR family transcriptional regulator [Gemmata algarum]
MSVTENRKPGRPRDPDLEARRKAQILDTAARVFATFGFANTQVQTIANHLGVGNGTVYRYFPTKEQLFLSAVERGLKELETEMDGVLAQPHQGADLIRAAVRAYLGFFHRRPEMAELFIQERAAFPHHHRPLYFVTKNAEAECKHEAFFNHLVSAGAIRAVPRDRFFNVLGDLLYGTILTNLLTGRPSDPDAQAADVLDVVLNGVLAAKETR